MINEVAENPLYKGYCKEIAGGSDLWKDLFQDTYIEMIRYQGKCDDPRRLFYVIASRIWLKIIKKERHGEVSDSIMPNDQHYFDQSTDTPLIIAASERVMRSGGLHVERFKVYLKEGSKKKAAKKLNLHRNTVSASVKKVEQQIRETYDRFINSYECISWGVDHLG